MKIEDSIMSIYIMADFPEEKIKKMCATILPLLCGLFVHK